MYKIKFWELIKLKKMHKSNKLKIMVAPKNHSVSNFNVMNIIFWSLPANLSI